MASRYPLMPALPALVWLLAASPAPAQQVRAEVRIATGPVAGRVVIGDRGYLPARVVVVDRGPRVVVKRRGSDRTIIIDEDRRRAHRQHGRHHKRHVRGYWDPRTNRFYFERWNSRLRPVLFCEHGKQYHLLDDIRDDHYDRSRRYD